MPELKLGKLAARLDSRTLRLSTLLRALPPLPPDYDLDKVLNVTDNREFGNLQYGNCVIAGRAHMTMRFEAYEQGKLINITDQEVIDQYLRETGGKDVGLVMLDSLKTWRKDGWIAASNHHDIYAFASLNWKNHGELMAAIYLLGGFYCGLLLPDYFQVQFDAGHMWDDLTYPPNLRNGHAVYISAWRPIGVKPDGHARLAFKCMTWGKEQWLSEEYIDKYVEEAYAVIDNSNKWMANSPVDTEKLAKILTEITGSPPPEPLPVPTIPWHQVISRFLEIIGGFMKQWLLTNKQGILNILILMVVFIQALQGQTWLNPGLQVAIVALLNAIIGMLREPVKNMQARRRARKAAG